MKEMQQSNIVLAINFMIAITLIPLGVELFGLAGNIIFGDVAVAMHPWLSTMFAYLPILILVWIYAKATLEPMKKYGFSWSKDKIWFSVTVGLVSAFVIYAIDSATGILENFGISPDPSIVLAAGFILALGVLVPLTEEFLFRGIIQTTFEERIKSTWKIHPAILIASGFEVLMHLSVPLYFTNNILEAIISTIPQLIYVAIFGAIGGWVYYKTRSLAGPIIIHAVGNVGELLLFWILV